MCCLLLQRHGPELVGLQMVEAAPMVVVRVNGSPDATAALDFAAQEAALRHLPLKIVSVWRIPLFAEAAPFGPFARASPLPRPEQFRRDAELALEQAVERAALLQPSVRCEARLVEGRPARVLAQEAHGATLLVVGSPRKTQITKWPGRTGRRLISRAPCPVTVVRGPTPS